MLEHKHITLRSPASHPKVHRNLLQTTPQNGIDAKEYGTATRAAVPILQPWDEEPTAFFDADDDQRVSDGT